MPDLANEVSAGAKNGQHWREVFDRFPRLIWLEDSSQRVVNANRALLELFSMTSENIIGKKIMDLPLVSVSRDDVRRSGPFFLEVAAPSGSVVRYEIMACPLFQGKETMLTSCGVSVYNDVKKSLELYAQAITKAHEQERLRVSRDLHDSIVQSLIVILHQTQRFLHNNKHLPLKHTRFLWDLREQIRNTIQEVRYISMNLRPSVLDLGLVPAIEWLIEQVGNEYGLEISLDCRGTARRLLPEGELGAFRITQEALHNVVKHAQTTRARVIIEFTEDDVRLAVADDGKGLKCPNSLEELLLAGKFGLAGIFERARILGGTAKITSPGEDGGATVEVRFPLAKNATQDGEVFDPEKTGLVRDDSGQEPVMGCREQGA